MRLSCHHQFGAGYLQVLRLGGDITRCPRGVLTPLAWHLLTGHPNGGPLMHSPGRPGVIISASVSLPPMSIGVLITRGQKFISRGVEGDSPPLRLTWWLHHLLVWGCWLTLGGWEWLVQGWCHLRSLQWWGLQHLSPQCLSLSFCHDLEEIL